MMTTIITLNCFIIFCIVAAALGGAVAQAFLATTLSYSIAAVYFKAKKSSAFYKEVKHLVFWTVSTSILYMLSVYQSIPYGYTFFDFEYISILVKFLIGPVVFIYSVSLNWSERFVMYSFLYMLIAICTILLIAKITNGITTGFVIGGLHSNFMGVLGFILFVYSICFCFIAKHGNVLLRFLVVVLALSVVVVSYSRGAMAASLVFVLVYFITGFSFYKRTHSALLFISCISLIVLVSFSFADWVESNSGYVLGEYTQSITGKEIDTGRGKKWTVAIDRIYDEPINGIGVEARGSWERDLKDGTTITLSVHNYYLAVMLESGIVGFVAVSILLFVFFKKYIVFYRSRYFRVGVACFIAVLVHQVTEVSLTTGTFTLGSMIWFFWGCLLKLAIGENFLKYTSTRV